MKKRFLFTLIFSLLVLTACSSDTPNATPDGITPTTIVETQAIEAVIETVAQTEKSTESAEAETLIATTKTDQQAEAEIVKRAEKTKVPAPAEKPSNFRKRFYRILDGAGIEHKGLHSLRHTFATNLVNGVKQPDGTVKSLTPKQVGDLLGHSTSQITEMYYVKRDNSRLIGITDNFEI